MMEDAYTSDGTPIHAGLAQKLTGRHPMYSLVGFLEGVVLKAHYKDDPDNLSGSWTEYDVMEVTTRQRFKSARVMSLYGGPVNGEETTLAETTGTTDGSPLVLEDTDSVSSVAVAQASLAGGLVPTPTYKMNGERVLFVCVGAAHTQAIIVGSAPHPAASYFANRSEAPRTLTKINGWTNSVANDTTLSFIHDDGRQIVATKDGDIIITAKGDAVLLKVKQDGTIELGDGATEQLLKGTTYRSAEDTLNNGIAGIPLTGLIDLFDAAAQASVGPLSAYKVVFTGIKAAYVAFEKQASGFLSNVSKTK